MDVFRNLYFVCYRNVLVEPLIHTNCDNSDNEVSQRRTNSLTKFDFPHTDANKLSEEETSVLSSSSSTNNTRTVSRDTPCMSHFQGSAQHGNVILGEVRISDAYFLGNERV